MPRQTQSNELDAIVQLLAVHGFDGMAQAIDILLNEAMKLQRSEALRAGPYERTRERRGHASGFKPKTVVSRLGSSNSKSRRPAGHQRRISEHPQGVVDD